VSGLQAPAPPVPPVFDGGSSGCPPDGRRQLGQRLARQPLARHLLMALAAALGFYLLTSALSPYDNFQVGEIAAYAVALAGLSVLTGVNGQISLGHGALMAVGAYTLGLLMTHTQLTLIVELLAAVGVTTVLGIAVGIPSARLAGPYLAGVTLMLALGLPLLADQYSSTFGGDQGLSVTPPSAPGSLDPQRWLAWIQIAAALVTIVLLANLLQSRFGRALRAVRDDEVAAELAGIHVGRTKVLAFAVSAACAGLAGALLVLSTGIVNTGEFPLSLSIDLLAGMVLGGAGSLTGVWWGAVALVYLPQWSTSLAGSLSLGSGVSAYLATVIFGLILIVVMLAAPSGLQGLLRWLRDRALGALRRVPAAAAVPAMAPHGDRGGARGGDRAEEEGHRDQPEHRDEANHSDKEKVERSEP
jgi:branched-chain amino acid transport system permease protein